ncbi:helicase and polymerase-containing TEBICHI isoform X1 [Chlorella sorokiniana]|uniref:DNA-directed DNA polymerase n=1 Tax=Chlorella sorokiniana TaxID=3076 RepID=A0A2P6TK08_CHLSO|nr:helicase and polymerase-containing TEBICHI isoform X1 [Chlorella sorokiniana]|eukprot:PRW44411.1 helicase and polymerase-containing TEBICHI isoform X1 [Chlorella sorokiniana]
MHTLPGVDYVPDTPEEEGLAAAADQQAALQQQLNGGGDALLRQALRRSAEKARSSDDAGAATAVAAAVAAPSAAQAQQAAGLPAVQAGGAPPSAAALTRDLTNQPYVAAPTSSAPVSAAPQAQGGAHPPFRPVLPPQLGAGGPVPLAQHQRQQQPASFLAGARAALQEASAGGAQHSMQQQQAQQQHAQTAPLQPLHQAQARPGQAPQLPLHRSPHATGLASVPIPVTAAAPADSTPQALQLGLERTPGAEAGAPLSGKTDGGASFASDMDDELLNRIASLERKALQASHQQAQQPGQPAPPVAGFQQQQAQQAAAPPQQQQQQVRATTVPAPLAGQSLPRVPPSSDGPNTGWSDTPDSACLAALDRLEQAAAGRVAATVEGADGAGGAAAAPATEAPRAFDYLYSEDDDEDSEDEEADRNLPLLSQYVQSGGGRSSPARRQQEERRRGASRSPLGLGTGGEGEGETPGQDARSPLGGQPPASGPDGSPMLSADPAVIESYLSADLAAAFRKATGITGRLYDWQAECLTQEGVLSGRNLVYCAPTSGGKSLVAEVLMLRRILTTNRPAMLVLPFVSICSEKSEHLSKVLGAIGKEVKEFYGGNHSQAALTATTGVIVCTIEKANIIINRMLEDQTLGLLSCLVVDELHMVGEDGRGYQLELLLTKLRYAAAACDDADGDYLSEGLQIVGMSATLPNVDKVAKWLNAELFQTDFRPVPLQSYMKKGLALYDEALQLTRALEVPPGWDTSKNGDSDHCALLARETVAGGHSVLVFCGTKQGCEVTAKRAARMIDILERQLRLKDYASSQRPSRASLLEELRRVPGGADPGLLECVARGAAFHHAGLSVEERDIVELAYRCGAVSVLCATSTLAAGVNLPARRVIIRHAWKGRPTTPIDGTCYRQMAGRAGRAGIDTHGECILINQDIGQAVCEKLFTSGAAPVASCLVEDKKGMKRAMLEVVVSGAVVEPPDVERYIRCTLLAAMNDYQKVADTTIAALRWLGAKEHPFIFWDETSRTFQPTPFGKAVLASGLPPEDCLVLKDDLERARRSFVMTTELHLTYLCVPPAQAVAYLDWGRFQNALGTLAPADASVSQKVGVDRAFVMRQARGIRAGGPQDVEKERICKRFWTALILTDIIAEVDVETVMRKFQVRRGDIQDLQDKAARHASMTAAFCERLGWYDLEALIAKFQSRVLHGVRPEILALSEIPFVKAYTARLLYRAGLRTPEAVAAVENVDQIVSILADSKNPDSRNKLLVRRQALKILRGARELLNRRARELREQAEEAFRLVESADKVELAHGEAAAQEVAAGEGVDGAAAERPAGPEEHGQQDVGQPAAAQQQQQQLGERPGGGAVATAAADGAGSGRAARPSGRSVAGAGAGPGRSVQTAVAAEGGRGSGGTTSWRSGGGAGEASDGEEGEEDGAALDAPSEAEQPPDAWRYGGLAGVHVLDQPEDVRQMVALLLGPAQQAQQAQQAGQRYEFVGFVFDTVATGSAAGAAALLPKGPTAAQRRDNAAHDKQSADVGVRLEGVALSWRSGQAFYVPLNRRDDLLAELAPLFASPALEKATWDLRAQLAAVTRVLGRAALGVPGADVPRGALALRDPLVDVRVAAWLSTPDDKKLKDENAHSVGGRQELFTLSSMLKSKGGASVWAEATQGTAGSAAAVGQRRADAGRAAAQARKMWHLLRSRLRGDELLPPLWRTEMPLVRVVVDMEAAGLAVNEDILNTEEPQLQRRIQELEALAHQAAGREFNLGSPQEVSHVLFEVLAIPPPPNARDLKGGGFSTGQEVLLELAKDHAIARIIWEHRKLRTLLNRFVQGFKMHLAYAEAVAYPGGLLLKRIRGSINQTCADTGRLAMDEPNLQCVPKPRAYKVLLSPSDAAAAAGSGEDKASGHELRTANLRAAFVAPPGCVLLSADYRQIEFRLMAHFSGDEGLCRIFGDAGGADPFVLLAAQWLGIPASQVTQQQRDHAKQLTYGLLYGMGAAKLADELGCGLEEAKDAQEKFRRSLPGVEAWQARVVQECKRQGYVETIAGRRRYLPEINSKSGQKRAAAERKAKNTVAQGSAADLAKAAMIAIHTALARQLPPGSARLVLQIHDEFLLEVAEPLLPHVACLVRDCMEGAAAAVRLRVPLRVRLAAGPSWGQLGDLQLPPSQRG